MYGSRCSHSNRISQAEQTREHWQALLPSLLLRDELLLNFGQITLFLPLSSSSQAFWSRLASYDALHFAQSVPWSQLCPLNAASVETAVMNGRSLTAECFYNVRFSVL